MGCSRQPGGVEAASKRRLTNAAARRRSATTRWAAELCALASMKTCKRKGAVNGSMKHAPWQARWQRARRAVRRVHADLHSLTRHTPRSLASLLPYSLACAGNGWGGGGRLRTRPRKWFRSLSASSSR
eukprot:364965-Chlamydomonas_euryale.AAC.5